MMTKTMVLGVVAAVTVSGLCACTETEEEQPLTVQDGGSDLLAGLGGTDGKADGASSAKLIDDIAPDALIKGKFDPRVRVYGYIVEARRGATLKLNLGATAGADARGPENGAVLDTRMGIYGPFESLKKPGAALAETDDGANGVAAPDIEVKIEQDARYLIAFSSWEDTGEGKYELNVGCEGTDLQCRRPDFSKPCKNGQLFIQGASIDEDTTWETCDVVILEPLSVAKDATLTVRPGVSVRGNFLGSAPFGNVTLSVQGTLQAVGTPESPIVFTSFKEDGGWGGIVLTGQGHAIEHAFVERAGTAITLMNQTTANITDTVIEGIELSGTRSRAGIRAAADVDATFKRALVKGFENGLELQNAQRLIIEDSIIRNNNNGVLVQGPNATTQCNGAPQRVTRFRDPVFIHTDIIDNTGIGILVNGSDILLQVEHSNIINNGGIGIDVRSTQLAPDSFIRNNNIHGNHNGRLQVRSFHRGNASLDISDNHWKHISDPELSASWQINCNGRFAFTGFSPVALPEAGPREEKLVDPVQKQTFAASQN